METFSHYYTVSTGDNAGIRKFGANSDEEAWVRFDRITAKPQVKARAHGKPYRLYRYDRDRYENGDGQEWTRVERKQRVSYQSKRWNSADPGRKTRRKGRSGGGMRRR